jgi:hypothetical protein
MPKQQRPCPRCGGSDRFYLVAKPRNGSAPFWICNQCRFYEAADPHATTVAEPLRQLSPAEIRQVQQGYAAVAEWCAAYLWSAEGARALEYLRSRGLNDETIRSAKLGYHPNTPDGGAGPDLWRNEPTAYAGAVLGGMFGPQGRPKQILRGAITIPYYAGRVCTLIRGRKLDGQGAKYLSPAGVSLYAGDTPTLYNHNALAGQDTVLLTEGEFKALLPWQHGLAAVAQPGVSYFPASFHNMLANKTVIVCYDAETRRDPFQLSPGERGTLATVAKLTGIDLQEQIAELTQALAELQGKKQQHQHADDGSHLAHIDAIQSRLTVLRARLDEIRDLRIRVRVLRLPKSSQEQKIDLDGFIQRSGVDALRQRIEHAPDGRIWYAAHNGGGYRYHNGGMVNGQEIANYQARIVETIYMCDGQDTSAIQRLALQTPSGQRLTIDIPADEWADDKRARQAVRVGLREGTFDDDPREVLRAIRLLSNHGDAPPTRMVYTATGWEQINGVWHFLTSDGAINSSGITTNVRAEIDTEAPGNHYALCGVGDAAEGARAWLRFLRGEVCPQPLAMVLAAQAVLPLIHRFAGNAARSMTWIYHQSGSLKTALVRASILALYGPAFTAVRADGAPITKWDATGTALGLVVYYFRDLPVLVDDYKQGIIAPDQFKRFLHNYSEGTGRSRATKHLGLERTRQARCIVFSTAEDIPVGDTGIQARLLSMELRPDAVNTDALSELQRAGAGGHLAAFWRGLIQELAQTLDNRNETGMREILTRLIAEDDSQLEGHKRAVGTLRQNRMAWLVLSRWLQRAGYISAAEAHQFDQAHLETRSLLASVLEARQQENRPSKIFLAILTELITSGELVIERRGMPCPRCGHELTRSSDGWFCTGVVGDRELPCTYHLRADRIIGFRCEDGIGIFANRAFQAVSRVRNDQRQPFAYSSTAIWQQLDADGALVATDRKRGKPVVTRRNPAMIGPDGRGVPTSVLLLHPDSLPIDGVESELESRVQNSRSRRSKIFSGDLAQHDEESLDRQAVDPSRSKSIQVDPNTALAPAPTHMLDRPDRLGSTQVDPNFMAATSHESTMDRLDRQFLDLHDESSKNTYLARRKLGGPLPPGSYEIVEE